VSASPFVKIAYRVGDSQNTSRVVVVGTKAYFTVDTYSGNRIYMWEFDSVANTLVLKDDTVQGYSYPSLQGNNTWTFYDEKDLIYFLARDDSDSKLYMFSYSISADLITLIDRFDGIMMLDRAISGVAPHIHEKGFNEDNTQIYMIGPIRNGVHTIQDISIESEFTTGSECIAITDNFLFVDNSGTIEIWKYTDISDYFKEVPIETKLGEISSAEIITERTITTGQTIQIYNDSNNLLFTGAAYKRKSKDGKEFTYKCVGYDKEISRKFTASFTSKTAKEIMQYILDGDMNGDGTPTVDPAFFLYYSSSIDNAGSFTATYTLSFKNKTIKHIYDTLMDFEDGSWFVAPDGKVYAFALADIPASGETITQASGKIYGEPPEISQMMWELNKISLYGAIVSGARLQNEAGYGEDIPSQQQNGINEFLRHYPHVDIQATLNTLADAVLARTGLTNNPIYVVVAFKEIGFEQVGKTLNFQFTPYPDLVSATDYYILSQIYYAKQDIASLVLSSGIIQEGREHEATLQQTSDADEEQIDILADELNTVSGVASSALQNIIEDASPELAAALDCKGLYLYNCASIRHNGTYIYFYPTNQTGYYFRMHNSDSNMFLFGHTNMYIDSDNGLYLRSDSTLQLYGNHSSGYAINMTASAFYPTSNKSHDLGLSGNAWDDLYFDDWHNVGTRFVNLNGLWDKYLNMKIESHPTAETSVGDAEIDMGLLIPELREEDRYEKQYEKKFVAFVANILKASQEETSIFCRNNYKSQEDCPNDIKDSWRKPPEDMTPQEYGVSMSQWTLINCMIIKELMTKNEALELRINALENK
jgi:hypothetical protein